MAVICMTQHALLILFKGVVDFGCYLYILDYRYWKVNKQISLLILSHCTFFWPHLPSNLRKSMGELKSQGREEQQGLGRETVGNSSSILYTAGAAWSWYYLWEWLACGETCLQLLCSGNFSCGSATELVNDRHFFKYPWCSAMAIKWSPALFFGAP